MNNIQKAAVIGCGFVGSSIAFTLMQSGIFSELVLIDANRDKAEGEAIQNYKLQIRVKDAQVQREWGDAK